MKKRIMLTIMLSLVLGISAQAAETGTDAGQAQDLTKQEAPAAEAQETGPEDANEDAKDEEAGEDMPCAEDVPMQEDAPAPEDADSAYTELPADIPAEDAGIREEMIEDAGTEEALQEEIIEESITVLNGWKDGSYYRDGTMLTGLQEIDGRLYGFGSDGKLLTGWRTLNDKTVYLGQDGVARTGWQTINDFIYYFGNDGAQRRGWQTIGGKKYYFFKSTLSQYKGHYKGVMVRDLNQIDGYWYYFNEKGAMQTGWQTVKGKKYYFDGSGRNLRGICTINKCDYLLPDGYAKDGIVEYKGKKYLCKEGLLFKGLVKYNDFDRYYLKDDHTIYTGWKTINKKTYYFQPGKSGKAAKYWTMINGFKYYFDDSVMTTGLSLTDSNYRWNYFYEDTGSGHYRGAMAKNTWLTINGRKYHAGKDGSLDTGFVRDGKGLRYFGGDAVMRTGWQYIDRSGITENCTRQTINRWFYFGKDGYAATGKKTINGKTYTFGSNGVLKGITDYQSANADMKKSMAASIYEGHLVYDAIGCSITVRDPSPILPAQFATDLDSTGCWNIIKGNVYISDHVSQSFYWLNTAKTGDVLNILRGKMGGRYRVIAKGYGKNIERDIMDTNGGLVSKRLNGNRVCLYTCVMDRALLDQGKEVFWAVCEKY